MIALHAAATVACGLWAWVELRAWAAERRTALRVLRAREEAPWTTSA